MAGCSLIPKAQWLLRETLQQEALSRRGLFTVTDMNCGHVPTLRRRVHVLGSSYNCSQNSVALTFCWHISERAYMLTDVTTLSQSPQLLVLMFLQMGPYTSGRTGYKENERPSGPYIIVRFELPTAVTPCSLVEFYRYFGWIYNLHRQGQRVTPSVFTCY